MSIAVENPTKTAIFGLLQDAALQTAVGGRLFQSFPEDVARPCVGFTIGKENNGGFGLARGPFKISLRTYALSEIGVDEAQSIDGQIQDLLADAKDMTISGFKQCGEIVYGDTPPPMSYDLNGILVHEVSTNYTLEVEL